MPETTETPAYTYLSATYSSPDQTSAVAMTAEVGAVIVSATDAQQWLDMHAACIPTAWNQQPAIDTKLAQLRAVREQILNRMAGIALAAQMSGDTATASAYLTARQGLLDITKTLPSDLAGTRATVISRYQSIVATLNTSAPALVSAFAGVDL